MFQRFGTILTIITSKGKQKRHIAFYHNNDWTKQRNGLPKDHAPVDVLAESIRLRSRSRLGMPCCIGGTTHRVEMHHVRHIRTREKGKPEGISLLLRALNRKQLPVCTICHQKIHRGEYDGVRLGDLAYNPYPPSVKRRRFRESRMQ